MATTKKNTAFDTTTLLTGVVALISIFLISFLADNAITADAARDANPCMIIKCPQHTQTAQAVGADGDMIQCQCPNDPEPYYKVALRN